MEVMLELRRQGVFRLMWTREQGVIKSVQSIGHFGDALDNEAQAVFLKVVSTAHGALNATVRCRSWSASQALGARRAGPWNSFRRPERCNDSGGTVLSQWHELRINANGTLLRGPWRRNQ